MISPLVSIIISAYNAQIHMGETLRSVLDQTWENTEIIVVNDGSTDDTLAVLQQFTSKGIRIVNQENKGQDAALNAGFLKSRGEYIKFMDSDDLLNPHMIERQVNALSSSQQHVAYGEWSRFYNDDPSSANFTKLNYWEDMAPLDFMTARPEGVMLQCGIFLIPRKLILKAGLWNESLILFNDTEFFTRVLLISDGVKFSPGARLYYRSGQPGSVSAGRTRKYFESTFKATDLMAQHLLAAEDSVRVRHLIGNTYLAQYYNLYPNYPDLVQRHREKFQYYGTSIPMPDQSLYYRFFTRFISWEKAKKLQNFIYKIGFLKIKRLFKAYNLQAILN